MLYATLPSTRQQQGSLQSTTTTTTTTPNLLVFLLCWYGTGAVLGRSCDPHVVDPPRGSGAQWVVRMGILPVLPLSCGWMLPGGALLGRKCGPPHHSVAPRPSSTPCAHEHVAWRVVGAQRPGVTIEGSDVVTVRAKAWRLRTPGSKACLGRGGGLWMGGCEKATARGRGGEANACSGACTEAQGGWLAWACGRPGRKSGEWVLGATSGGMAALRGGGQRGSWATGRHARY